MNVRLSLDALKHLDHGRLVVAWNDEIRKVICDLRDRPALKKPRKIVLQMTIWPGELVDRDLDDAVCGFSIRAVLPQRDTADYRMRVTQDNGLRFQSEAPEDPNQSTIDELMDRGDA